MGLDFTVVPEFAGVILLGAWWTLVITISAGIISFFGGIVLALIALYGHWALQYPVRLFAWLFMGTPLFLQLFLIYFGLVQIGIDVPALIAGILALGIHFAVYNSDIIQAGIKAIDKGQSEAARTLGMSQGQNFRYIIVPQAVRSVVPPIGTNTIALLKDSALVSAIGVTEMVHSAQLAISETFRPFEFYIVVAILFYIINLGLEFALYRIEKKISLAR